MQKPKATVLAVDDSEDILNLIAATLGREHRVKLAPEGPTALRLAFEEPRPELILLDVEMPEGSGYEICKTLKASPAVADVPVVFLSGRSNPRDVVQGFQLGAIDYLSKPINPPVLAARVRIHLELIARRHQQDELIRERTAQLEQTRLQLIRRLGRVMEYHETSAVGNRVVRLGHYARALAQAAGARPPICDLIMKAAPLHDIGKVGVPVQLLRKAGSLSVPEREQMQRHPEIGAEIIGEHDDPLLKLARTLALTHHERWDGTGYPAHARGADIPWAGRVMAVVDAFESMTTTQFHRGPMTVELAASEISGGAGKQFDPVMVEAFRKALPEFRHILQTYGDQLGDILNLDFASKPSPAPAPAPQEKAEVEARSAQAARDADAARAKALADAHARLQVERDLAAAASRDIVSQHAALKRAEEASAREAELLHASRQRTAEEATAARLTQERVAAEEKAEQAALQAQMANELARLGAQEKAAADEALTAAAARRRQTEESLARSAQERAAAAARAAEAARTRAAEETAAAQAAQARRQAAAEAAAAAQQAQESNEVLSEALAARAEAEAALADARQSADQAGSPLADEESAEQAALQAQAANEQARLSAQEKAAADEALTAAAARRRQAEESLARAAQERAAAAARAAEAARLRAAEETALADAALEKQSSNEAAAKSAAAAADADEKAARAARRRALAEAAARVAGEERTNAERAALAAAQKLEGATRSASATADAVAVAPSPAPVLVKRPPRVVHAYLAVVLALAAGVLGFFAHQPEPQPARIEAEASPPRPMYLATAELSPLDSRGVPLLLQLDRRFDRLPSGGGANAQ